jgi:hypothetical protein
MQDQIFKVKNKKIQSVKKFQDLYRSNKIALLNDIALNIINFLEKIGKFKSGSFVDLRNFS